MNLCSYVHNLLKLIQFLFYLQYYFAYLCVFKLIITIWN